MRKSLHAIGIHGRRSASLSQSPLHIHELYAQDTDTSFSFFQYSTPIIDKAFDFAILSFIAVILLLSLLSLFCIFKHCLKSRSSLHLRSFNNRWTIRLLLVAFVSAWAVNEFLRLPFIRETLNFSEQTCLCKLHVVLSLGFLEPGFLITLLYLINVSLKQKNQAEKWSLLLVIVMSIPTLILQIIFFFTPLKEKLPWIMTRTSLLFVDSFGKSSMICIYPFLSSILFCVYAIVYSMGLLLACWRVGSLVINKTMRVRINVLGVTVMAALLVQTLFLGAESLWTTAEEMGFVGVSLGMFESVAVCAVVGEMVLVIKPIRESLETAGRDYSCQFKPPVLELPITTESGRVANCDLAASLSRRF